MSLSLSDLRYAYFGGNSSAEYAVLLSAYQQGINAQDVITGAYNGAGSPEGAITAPVGSLYRDTTNGVAYIKQTGVGNTGWVVMTPVQKAARGTTGSIAANTSVDVTINWPVAFADTNYTVVAQVENNVQTGLRILRIRSKTVAGVTFRVINDDIVNPQTGTIHMIGIHD